MQNILVSIIVPVYNAEQYLSACIESIQGQSYRNLEIILVDDGSSDSCPQICDEYAQMDSRILVIHQPNKGVSAARNAGLHCATGEYYAFVDSDDELRSNAIEFLLSDVQQYNADIASAVKSTVLQDGTVSSVYEDHSLSIYSGLEMLELSLDGERQTNSACAKLFRRTLLGSVRFIEGKSINEDGFYVFQCYSLKPTVVQHNVSVYLYYIRTNSNSRNVFSEKYFDMLYFCERKKEIVKNTFPELLDKLITMEVSTHLFFLEILCRTVDKKYDSHIKESVRLVKRYYNDFYCINKHEMKMAWIVAHGLYPLYKILVRLKYYK